MEHLLRVPEVLGELGGSGAIVHGRLLLARRLAALQRLLSQRLLASLAGDFRIFVIGDLTLVLLLRNRCSRGLWRRHRKRCTPADSGSHHRTLRNPLIGEETNNQDNDDTDYEGVVHSSNQEGAICV